jgi:hypothetical protein
VNTTVQGGSLIYTLAGLEPGSYHVYTYAANPNGSFIETPITVPEAVSNNTQVVTGPMPGNSFKYLVTHSLHQVEVTTGSTFRITASQPPGMHANSEINGFQIVPVPEPNSAIVIAGLLAFSAIRGFGRYNVAGDLK